MDLTMEADRNCLVRFCILFPGQFAPERLQMNKKLSAALMCCLFLQMPFSLIDAKAQEPMTFVDEDGETITYGEEKEWTRTITLIFPDNHYNDYSIYQTTKGNEIWITPEYSPTEYHIGNNGECGWDEVYVPKIEGYEADRSVIPEVDLYYHPEQAANNKVIVTYTRLPMEMSTSISADSPEEETTVPQGTVETETQLKPTTVPSAVAAAEEEHAHHSWYLYGALVVFVIMAVASGTLLVSKLLHSAPDEEDYEVQDDEEDSK